MIDRFFKYLGYEKPAKAPSRQKRVFSGAQMGNLYSTWKPSNLSANAEIWRDLQTLRARSRDRERNDGYAKKFFRMVDTNVIGPNGIKLQSQVKNNKGKPDEAARKTIETAFKEFCEKGNCDVTGRHTFINVASLAIRSMARDGEVLIRIVSGYQNKHRFALQLIEADHLDENHYEQLPNGHRIIMGVEVDKWGKPVAYHLHKTHPGDLQHADYSYKEKEIVPASEILHLFLPMRISQLRGIPWIHAALARIQMLDGYEEAELVAARLGASKGGFYKREGGGEWGGDTKQGNNPILEVEPGTYEILPEGWDFQAYDPTHPTTAFSSYVKAVMRGIASALDVSYNFLANDLEHVNYSSIRAGVLDEREVWRALQKFMIDHFYMPVFEKWLEMALLTQAVKLPFNPEKYKQSNWMPRGWKWVDPKNDAQAVQDRIDKGLTTHTKAAAEQGEDFDDNVLQLIEENKKLKDAGLLKEKAEKNA